MNQATAHQVTSRRWLDFSSISEPYLRRWIDFFTIKKKRAKSPCRFLTVKSYVRFSEYLEYLYKNGIEPKYDIKIKGLRYIEVPKMCDGKPVINSPKILISEKVSVKPPKLRKKYNSVKRVTMTDKDLARQQIDFLEKIIKSQGKI